MAQDNDCMQPEYMELEDSKCWYCENELAISEKFGQKICDTCSNKGKEIRTSAPTHLMDEYEKAEQLRVGIRLFI